MKYPKRKETINRERKGDNNRNTYKVTSIKNITTTQFITINHKLTTKYLKIFSCMMHAPFLNMANSGT